MSDTVLITGGGSGLGLALAECYARDGHSLILTARNEQRLSAAKDRLESTYHVPVTVIAANLGKAEGPEALMTAIQAQGLQVDVLVNNAGFGDFGDFADSDLAKQQAMVSLNITALMTLCHAVLPVMRQKRHGRILNVASIAAFQSGPYMSVYYATKAFVLSFSEALARELKGSGITVTALCPGPIRTGFEEAASLENSALFRSLPVSTAEEVAAYGYRAAQKGKPVAVHGVLNRLLVFGVRFAPRRLVTNMVCRIQGAIAPKNPS